MGLMVIIKVYNLVIITIGILSVKKNKGRVYYCFDTQSPLEMLECHRLNGDVSHCSQLSMQELCNNKGSRKVEGRKAFQHETKEET